MHRQPQGEYAQQKIGDGLRKTVERRIHVIYRVHEHQHHNTDEAGDGNVEGLGSPEHHRQGHHR